MGVPELWNEIVDVRDVATAHIKAGYTPEASGRHIIVGGEATLLNITNILRKHFGDDYQFPRKQVPKFLFWIIAPMNGFTPNGVIISFKTGCATETALSS